MMENAKGGPGIEVHVAHGENWQIESMVIELDSQTRELLDFVNEMRLASATYNGFNFGKTFLDLLDDVAALHTQINEDRWYRENNPAVKEAWENYQLMLGLVREKTDEDEDQ